MLRDSHCEEVCAIDVHSPELLQSVVRVRDGIEVFGEAGRCHEVIDFAVLLEDLSNRVLDRFG